MSNFVEEEKGVKSADKLSTLKSTPIQGIGRDDFKSEGCKAARLGNRRTIDIRDRRTCSMVI